MRRISQLILSGVVALIATGCGGSDAGSGTRTLWVKALAVTDDTSDGTGLIVEVRQGGEGGERVTDAVVIVEGNNTGEFAVPWDDGKWFGIDSGYHYAGLAWDTGWRISVKRGDDELYAYLEAPGVTRITNPVAETTFRRAEAQNLLVEWEDLEGRDADFVEVDFKEADDADATLDGDPGELEVDFNRLRPDHEEHLSVNRRNQLNLEGGVPGSTFTAESHHGFKFTVE